jgi:hypothetical protein
MNMPAHRKHDRESIVAHLKEQRRCGDKSLVANKRYRQYLKVQGDNHFAMFHMKDAVIGCSGAISSSKPRYRI